MTTADDDLRAVARKKLKKKADFKSYLFVWGAVSALLTVIWFFVSPEAPFWPGFAIAGMGLAAVFVWWDAYGPSDTITEAAIDAEVKRMKDKS